MISSHVFKAMKKPMEIEKILLVAGVRINEKGWRAKTHLNLFSSNDKR